ncbi:CoA transferase [bacterium]|nr:CoA transferase [bacterium]
MKPLASLKVLDLSQLLPGPFMTAWLDDLGADVTRIEPPQGEPTRLMFPEMFKLLARDKSELRLNLKDAADRDKLLEMAAEADAVVEQFRPGVMDRLGLGWDALKARNPAIVLVSLTGFGQDGPYAKFAGHDMNYRAIAGELHQAGTADSGPAPGNYQTADIAGGSLTAGIGLLAAVVQARATGEGAHVDVAMTDSIFAQQAVNHSTQLTTGKSPERGRDMLSGGLANYSVYETSDGNHVALGALEPKFWQAFCVAAEAPELLPYGLATGDKGAEGRRKTAELIASRSRDAWAELGQQADCCLFPVLTPDEALHDPHLRARGIVVDAPDGKFHVGCPIKFSG